MLKTTLIAASMVLAASAFAGSALAQGVVIERAAPAEPSASTTTIEKHGVDCDSKTVHRENDLGESKTVTRTNCD